MVEDVHVWLLANNTIVVTPAFEIYTNIKVYVFIFLISCWKCPRDVWFPPGNLGEKMDHEMEQGGGGEVVEEQNRVKSIQSQLDETTDIMKQNVNRLVEREVRLEDLTIKTKNLQDEAQNFKHTAQKVARSYWWKNVKLVVVIMVIVLIILLMIILLATGVIPTSSGTSPPVPGPTKKPIGGN
ncbi:hypothetical protein JZ751_001612 [Albula glossodonta]|uniref:V-SNARE coiled-coil homology domain-containing protein n=1 Tax=Albula glossodonta TaxID=121402 RepID=A0A8T2PU73_9TELE|nr:hypothetical protein JZ751_001612 [Albula glossodonta]